MKKSTVKPLLIGRGKNSSMQITANKIFIFFRDFLNDTNYAFDYSGLKLWLKELINSTIINNNISLKCNSDSKIRIPAGSWVKGIRLYGSATGITITFNGYEINNIDNISEGYEIQPRKQYVESDSDLTVSATNWGVLEIIIFI